MTALTAANARIGALVRAVLILEYPLPVSTTAVAERVSYRYDPAVYRALARMEHQGEIEKISVPDVKTRYWRLAKKPRANDRKHDDDQRMPVLVRRPAL